jgi:uncharacterized RDD family membrane protein YckC
MKTRFPETIRMIESEFLIISAPHEEAFNVFYEFILGYFYFVMFFRFKGQTPGKRIFRLKVVDLKGRKRIGWYQAFERTHGYAASGLFFSLGFLQVLWDAEGLTMHDKIAGTTVIRIPVVKKRKTKKRKPKKASKKSKKIC